MKNRTARQGRAAPAAADDPEDELEALLIGVVPTNDRAAVRTVHAAIQRTNNEERDATGRNIPSCSDLMRRFGVPALNGLKSVHDFTKANKHILARGGVAAVAAGAGRWQGVIRTHTAHQVTIPLVHEIRKKSGKAAAEFREILFCPRVEVSSDPKLKSPGAVTMEGTNLQTTTILLAQDEGANAWDVALQTAAAQELPIGDDVTVLRKTQRYYDTAVMASGVGVLASMIVTCTVGTTLAVIFGRLDARRVVELARTGSWPAFLSALGTFLLDHASESPVWWLFVDEPLSALQETDIAARVISLDNGLLRHGQQELLADAQKFRRCQKIGHLIYALAGTIRYMVDYSDSVGPSHIIRSLAASCRAAIVYSLRAMGAAGVADMLARAQVPPLQLPDMGPQLTGYLGFDQRSTLTKVKDFFPWLLDELYTKGRPWGEVGKEAVQGTIKSTTEALAYADILVQSNTLCYAGVYGIWIHLGIQGVYSGVFSNLSWGEWAKAMGKAAGYAAVGTLAVLALTSMALPVAEIGGLMALTGSYTMLAMSVVAGGATDYKVASAFGMLPTSAPATSTAGMTSIAGSSLRTLAGYFGGPLASLGVVVLSAGVQRIPLPSISNIPPPQPTRVHVPVAPAPNPGVPAQSLLLGATETEESKVERWIAEREAYNADASEAFFDWVDAMHAATGGAYTGTRESALRDMRALERAFVDMMEQRPYGQIGRDINTERSLADIEQRLVDFMNTYAPRPPELERADHEDYMALLRRNVAQGCVGNVTIPDDDDGTAKSMPMALQGKEREQQRERSAFLDGVENIIEVIQGLSFAYSLIDAASSAGMADNYDYCASTPGNTDAAVFAGIWNTTNQWAADRLIMTPEQQQVAATRIAAVFDHNINNGKDAFEWCKSNIGNATDPGTNVTKLDQEAKVCATFIKSMVASRGDPNALRRIEYALSDAAQEALPQRPIENEEQAQKWWEYFASMFWLRPEAMREPTPEASGQLHTLPELKNLPMRSHPLLHMLHESVIRRGSSFVDFILGPLGIVQRKVLLTRTRIQTTLVVAAAMVAFLRRLILDACMTNAVVHGASVLTRFGIAIIPEIALRATRRLAGLLEGERGRRLRIEMMPGDHVTEDYQREGEFVSMSQVGARYTQFACAFPIAFYGPLLWAQHAHEGFAGVLAVAARITTATLITYTVTWTMLHATNLVVDVPGRMPNRDRFERRLALRPLVIRTLAAACAVYCFDPTATFYTVGFNVLLSAVVPAVAGFVFEDTPRAVMRLYRIILSILGLVGYGAALWQLRMPGDDDDGEQQLTLGEHALTYVGQLFRSGEYERALYDFYKPFSTLPAQPTDDLVRSLFANSYRRYVDLVDDAQRVTMVIEHVRTLRGQLLV